MSRIVLALTGATGSYLARALIEKSRWPVSLIASEWGKNIYTSELGPISELEKAAGEVFSNSDLTAPLSSGSVPTRGMIIAPCSINTFNKIASGDCSTLITRAAHCHLKEGKKLILCLREAPLSLIDLENAVTIARAGGIVMPVSPPFYMSSGKKPQDVTYQEMIDYFADRVLALLGQETEETWETIHKAHK